MSFLRGLRERIGGVPVSGKPLPTGYLWDTPPAPLKRGDHGCWRKKIFNYLIVNILKTT
jgi:hypothetical protein